MKQKVIRLTESDLHRMIQKSVNRIMKENAENEGFKDTFKKIGKKISDYADKEWEDEPVKKKVGTLRQGVNSGKIKNESILNKAVNESINNLLNEVGVSTPPPQQSKGSRR